MNPIVSVVIPVRNRVNELLLSIGSVLDQTLDNLEVIVVENNSTNPLQISEAVNRLNDSRVKFFSLDECSNANVARNYGSDVASGKYVSFLDSDDEYEPDHLENCLDLLDRTKSDFVYGSAKINSSGQVREIKARPLLNRESPLAYLFGDMPGWAPTPTYLIRKSILENVRWDESLHRHQDFDFFIQVTSTWKAAVNEKFDVVINWPAGVKRNYDSGSMRIFYRKWHSSMSNREKQNYAEAKLKAAIKNKDAKNIIFFFWVFAMSFLKGN